MDTLKRMGEMASTFEALAALLVGIFTLILGLFWLRKQTGKYFPLPAGALTMLGVGAKQSEDGTWYLAQVFGRK